MAKKQKGGRGNRKHGREKKKKERRGSPISLYVRDRISANLYFSLTNQKRAS